MYRINYLRKERQVTPQPAGIGYQKNRLCSQTKKVRVSIYVSETLLRFHVRNKHRYILNGNREIFDREMRGYSGKLVLLYLRLDEEEST